MTDPARWNSAQQSEFSNFQSNDNFNLIEVSGIDGNMSKHL